MMDSVVLFTLLTACAPKVHAGTAQALVAVESAGNPYAIGVVGGVLSRQPTSRAEAVAIAKELHLRGWDFSVGLGQINQRNFNRLGLTIESALNPCTNLAAMQAVLTECFDRAAARQRLPASALRDALSCYYSGNFTTGYRHGYVRKVVGAATVPRRPLPQSQSPLTATKEST